MAESFQKFWKIIDSTNPGRKVNRRSQVRQIAKILETLNLEELASFKRQLLAILSKAYTFNLLVAAFVIYSRISDDMFVDFRAWLILHGREIFEEAIRNPDSITSLVSKKEVGQINSDGFTEIPLAIWLDRGASLKMYMAKTGSYKIPVIKKNWPKDKEDFQKKYPVLFDAYWNAARIKALNT